MEQKREGTMKILGRLLKKSWYLVAYASGMMSLWTCETLNHHLRMGFARHLLGLKLKETEQMSAGGQMSLLQNEISEVSGYIGNGLANLLNTMIAFVITIIFYVIKVHYLPCSVIFL